MPLSPGSRLGPYEIVAPLGAGGMGEVWRARDSRLGREVALKVVPAALASDPDRLARFEREARTVAALNHPNIVTLFSVEEASGVRFLTMELVEGVTIDSLITPGGLPWDRVLAIAIPLADALVAAHAKGVVHRDLKPANVMLSDEGRVKVLDFGLARSTVAEAGPGSALDATMTSPLSTAGQVLGTVPYMAPEQVRGEVVDARTDLFAFGVLLYELASGIRPFTGASNADVGSAILRDTPAALSKVRPDTPRSMSLLVVRCLEKDRVQRFQAAADVRAELELVRLSGPPDGTSMPATPVSDSAAEGPSIAVLPFVNMSRDEENEYFSDGLSEELLNVLAGVRGLRVAARTSSFYFKGKSPTIAEVGGALNVSTVLEGSVRKSGNRVRITAQLIKVSDGYHLWSQTYDRTLEDIFAVQDEVARAVVAALPGEMLGSGSGIANFKGTRNSAAYDAYLEGRFFWNKRTEADMRKAIAFFEQAIALDPEFAEAYVGLADAYHTMPYYSLTQTGEVYPLARVAVDRALALKPGLGAAHSTLGYALMINWQWAESDVAFRRALELDPDDATAHKWYTDLLLMLGRSNAALREIRRAIELDPLSASIWTILGEWYWFEGQHDQAMSHYRKALELQPTLPLALELAARLCWQRDDMEQYLALRARLEAISTRVSVPTAEVREAYARGGREAVLRAQLAGPVARLLPSDRALWHAELGDMDAAFRDLDEAYEQREIRLPYAMYFADFARVWKDPRFAALKKRMGLGS